MMGTAEWGLGVMTAGVAAVAYLGWLLTRAIWTGRPIHRVPVSTSLLVAIVATLALPLMQRSGEPVVVAAVVSEPTGVCLESSPDSGAQVVTSEHRALVHGLANVQADCAIWAVIEDLGGGGIWLQGPATRDQSTWRL